MSRLDELVFDALVDVIGWTSWAVTGILMLTVLAVCKPIAMTLDLVAMSRSRWAQGAVSNLPG